MKLKRYYGERWLARAQSARDNYANGVMKPRTGAPPEVAPQVLADRATCYAVRLPAGLSAYKSAQRRNNAILRRVILPPRKPRGHVGNYRRTIAICAALHQGKVSRMTPSERAAHDPKTCGLCKYRVRMKNA